jgi:hypothetical protein
MEDILIIVKIQKMVDDMSSVSEGNIILKYAINAAKTMICEKCGEQCFRVINSPPIIPRPQRFD